MEASGKLMPLLALRGIIVFPGMTVNLDVGRDKSINAVNAAMQLDKKILLVTQRDAETADPKREELYNYGVVAEIKQLLKLPSGAIRILIQGLERAELTSALSRKKIPKPKPCAAYCCKVLKNGLLPAKK